MSNRIYNILFHTHTVSGIVISVVLFVIFFAGSFSFFRDEIINWERSESVTASSEIQLDFDEALDSLKKTHSFYGRDITISQPHAEQRVTFSATSSKDSLANDETKGSLFFYLNTHSYEKHDYLTSYTLGEFLYRLHFLAQIPYPIGYYLSGFTAFFFLFAILTGVLLHWKKIISNFYVFRPWEKLKTIWTDVHTSLGMIGLPFQFMYAVTGAFFMIKLLLVSPVVAVLYDGDQSQLYEDLEYNPPVFPFENEKLNTVFSINEYVEKAKLVWPDFNVTKVDVMNYGDSNMHLSIEGQASGQTKFAGTGKVIYQVSTGDVIAHSDPVNEVSYINAVKDTLFKLHYADYGGIVLKLISFVLGIITCFVIISGILIWLTARDKKNVPEKRKRFNESVVCIYMAVCMSMYPVTALSFIAVKIFNPAGQSFIYTFYFVSWLLLSLFFGFKKDNYFVSKYSLFSGGILGLGIPIVNGLLTGNWFWTTYLNHQYDIFIVDILWIVLGWINLYAALNMKKNNSDKMNKNDHHKRQKVYFLNKAKPKQKEAPLIQQSEPEFFAADPIKLTYTHVNKPITYGHM